jgi:hypothetical protein
MDPNEPTKGFDGLKETFDDVSDPPESGTKLGTRHDRTDMDRMGKLQELRVSLGL